MWRMRACKHYPLQYWMSRPEARAFYRQALSSDSPRPLEPAQSHRLAHELCAGAVVKRVKDGQLAKDAAAVVLAEDVKGLLVWAQWQHSGAAVYEVSPALARELWASDAGELRPADLLERPECFYLHFGLQDNDKPVLDNGTPVEGAYVVVAPGVSIRIVLCGRPQDDATQTPSDGRYDLRLVWPHTDQPVDAAIDRSLQSDLADVDAAAQQLRHAGHPAGAADALRQRLVANSAVYRECTRYLLNVMAYRRFVDDAVETQWGSEVPSSLRAKVMKGGKEGARAHSKLWFMGFGPTRVIGSTFESLLSAPGERAVAAHWRRGHFRNQPHGPQLSLRKIIWIRPVLVGG